MPETLAALGGALQEPRLAHCISCSTACGRRTHIIRVGSIDGVLHELRRCIVGVVVEGRGGLVVWGVGACCLPCRRRRRCRLLARRGHLRQESTDLRACAVTKRPFNNVQRPRLSPLEAYTPGVGAWQAEAVDCSDQKAGGGGGAVSTSSCTPAGISSAGGFHTKIGIPQTS